MNPSCFPDPAQQQKAREEVADLKKGRKPANLFS
jgi:hypothetical protein